MDPDEALRLIRAYIAQMRVEDAPVGGVGTSPTFVQHARDLAETVEGLDGWMSTGGSLPSAWWDGRRKPSTRSNDAGERQFMDCGTDCVAQGRHVNNLACVLNPSYGKEQG